MSMVTKVKGHFGGFSPVSIDLTAVGVRPGDEVTVAVCADNSDDLFFPAGGKQYTMDFVYLVASTVIVILSVPVTCM